MLKISSGASLKDSPRDTSGYRPLSLEMKLKIRNLYKAAPNTGLAGNSVAQFLVANFSGFRGRTDENQRIKNKIAQVVVYKHSSVDLRKENNWRTHKSRTKNKDYMLYKNSWLKIVFLLLKTQVCATN